MEAKGATRKRLRFDASGAALNAADPKSVPRPIGWTPAHEVRWKSTVFPRVMVTEGGLANSAIDRGGITKYGVSLRFLAIEGKLDLDNDHYGDFDLNRDGTVNSADIRLLKIDHAEAVGLRWFYCNTGFWRLPAPFDLATFDMGFNAGTMTAGKLLQRALNRIVPTPPLDVDGVVGQATHQRLQLAMREGLTPLVAYRQAADAYYRAIVASDPGQRGNLAGWQRRARELGRG